MYWMYILGKSLRKKTQLNILLLLHFSLSWLPDQLKGHPHCSHNSMNSKITLDNLYIGFKIIIIGLFLKSFIADSIAPLIDPIFTNYENFNGGTLLLGAIGFTIQIYGDFAGYSLIAIGVAKIINFDLMKNFNTPYFSISIQDFWRRWHISLSSFFRRLCIHTAWRKSTLSHKD